jgi:anti-anti-sigma regulatory factor
VATDYIDSAACGMLLLLKNLADAAGKTVHLSNAAGGVKQALRIMNFEKVFQIA